MKTKEEVLALLLALGKTEEEVAETLVSLGIRGNKWRRGSCPIANYLLKNGFLDAFVIANYAVIGAGDYQYLLSEHPQLTGVQSFIFDFDRGLYPKCITS